MNWLHFGIAVVVAGVAASFTDWLFFGVLFHNRYLANPEVWRNPGKTESKAIALSTATAFIAAALFFHVCYRLGMHGYWRPLKMGAAIWIIAALPVTVTNQLFIKLHSSLLMSHSLGWLARLLLFAAVYGWLIA